MGFVSDIFRNARGVQRTQELEQRAQLTPPILGDVHPVYLQDIIDAVGNWETEFNDLLRLSFRWYMDHLHAPIEAIDDARLAIALEGEQISDEIITRFPDLVKRSLRQDHPLTVALIEERGR